MQLELKPVEFFATPTDMRAMEAWLQSHTGSERVVATTAAMMMYNLVAKLVTEAQEGQSNEK